MFWKIKLYIVITSSLVELMVDQISHYYLIVLNINDRAFIYTHTHIHTHTHTHTHIYIYIYIYISITWWCLWPWVSCLMHTSEWKVFKKQPINVVNFLIWCMCAQVCVHLNVSVFVYVLLLTHTYGTIRANIHIYVCASDCTYTNTLTF